MYYCMILDLFLTSVFSCRKLNLKWIENDNSIALKRIGITEAHIGIPINMNEKPTLILINSCRHTMSDTSIELNLQSTILFTVHDFKQKSTAVFLHFKLLIYNPLFNAFYLRYSLEFAVDLFFRQIIWYKNLMLLKITTNYIDFTNNILIVLQCCVIY